MNDGELMCDRPSKQNTYSTMTAHKSCCRAGLVVVGNKQGESSSTDQSSAGKGETPVVVRP
jgi:hypothetical protein